MGVQTVKKIAENERIVITGNRYRYISIKLLIVKGLSVVLFSLRKFQ